jgi:bacillolysin
MKILFTASLIAASVFFWQPASTQSILNKPLKSMQGGVPLRTQPGITSGAPSGAGLLQNLGNFFTRIGVRSQAVSQRSARPGSTGSVLSVTASAPFTLPAITSPAGSDIAAVVMNNASGTPRFIEMKPVSPSTRTAAVTASEREAAAKNFLALNKALLNLIDPASELRLQESTTDDLHFTNLKFTQRYQGVDVWGKEFIVHFDARGSLVSANGDIERTPQSIRDVAGTLNETAAVETALRNIAAKSPILPVPQTAADILNYTGPVSQKVIWHDRMNIPHLVWVVEIRSGLSQDWFTFVDSNTGAVLNSYNAVCYDGIATATGTDLNGVQRTVKTYQIGANYFMIDATQPMFNAAQSTLPDSPVGAIVALDLKNADLTNSSSVYYVSSPANTWADPASVSAHYNAAVTYKYYLDTYGRNSVDNQGMTIYSVIHVAEQGKSMENAYWSGKIMCYGDGGTYFYPLAGGLDVAAHEMTHGVTQFSANLEYQGQSGALNESMSDAFGTLVDTLNWKIGEQIVKNKQAFPSGALRDMTDPHNGGVKGQQSWQPARMSEFVTTTDDNGGVHINSGIPNRAFYLTAAAIGRQKAGKIWYRTLTVYLTRSSQFIDARIATIKAAGDLYGGTGVEVASVKNAWDAVEVLDGTATPLPPASTLTGTEWILSVNTDPADPNSIYMAKTAVNTGADYFALTKTPVLNRPSVSDVSGVVLFIDQSNNLRGMNADPANPQETLIDDSGVWESVSIGPGLGSLALTSKFIDTTIYYFDLTKNISTSFKIATKTFDAVDKKTALYADALSFDPTGRYILFDAYNEVKNASGGKISFWNINILDVATGNMGVIFPPLADGLSVGNPAFSKTVSTRFTFDYIDDKTGQTYVMAADFNTGDVGTVAGPQSVLGYPSYSGDDKSIVYHTSATVSGAVHHSLEQMPLKSSFIEGTGVHTSYILDATFPTWFVVGKRTTDIRAAADGVPAEFAVLQNYPNPFNPSTTIMYSLPKNETVSITVYNMLGSKVADLVHGSVSAGNHRVTWNGTDDRGNHVSSGVYLLTIEGGSKSLTRKMLLMK